MLDGICAKSQDSSDGTELGYGLNGLGSIPLRDEFLFFFSTATIPPLGLIQLPMLWLPHARSLVGKAVET